MLLSNPNRKSFSLSLNIPLRSSARPSRDHSPSQWSLHSPSRDAFFSPLAPFVPSHLKQEQPILPIPLTDSLDREERMKLLKKTRKLSRILGEVPIPVSMDSEIHDLRYTGLLQEPSTAATSTSTSAASSPGKSPPGIEPQNPLKRSATVGHNRFAQQSEIQRARSLASLRPSLTLSPVTHITTRPSPLSSAERAWADLPPLPASPVSPASPSSDSAKGTVGPSRRDSTASVSTRRNSLSSLLHERTPEQVQRARAAKLARQLGEHIPADVLLRATSPPPRSPPASPSIMSFAEASTDLQEPMVPVRRTSSSKRTNRDRSQKRRLSLDVKTFVRNPDPKTDAPLLTDPVHNRVLLKKSNSAGKSCRPNTGGSVVEVDRRHPPMVRDSDADSDFDDDPDQMLRVEKQRALNVRRARKMNQVFGNDPPPALFQIRNLSPSPRAADETVSVALKITDCRRDSRATCVSVATSTFSASEIEGGRRNSEASGENVSPLVFAGPGSVPPSVSHTPRSETPAERDVDDVSVELPNLNPSRPSLVEACLTPPVVGLSLTSPSQQSIAPSVASAVSLPQSHAPSQHSQAPLISPTRASFRATSPPFANMVKWGSVSAPTSPPTVPSPLAPHSEPPPSATETSPSDPHFRTRRLRAAKLSRFFGVGLHDITGMLVTDGSSASLGSVPVSAAPAAPPVPPVPPVPSLYSSYKTESAETIPTPPASPTSMRPLASSGIALPEERGSSTSSSCPSRSSGGRRSQSATRAPRPLPTEPAPTQPSTSTSTDRARVTGAEPEPQGHGRTCSTTVEVAAESRGRYFFLEGRRAGKGMRELEMHAAIKQLRKIK